MFGLNAATDNNADNQFYKTVHNFSATHNAAQTMIGQNAQTIKQQVQYIAQLTVQMNSLQSKLDFQQQQQQQFHTEQANVHLPMAMPNQH